MKRDALIDKIINALYDNDCIDVNNFRNRSVAFEACAGVIEEVLEDYIVVKGEVLE